MVYSKMIQNVMAIVILETYFRAPLSPPSETKRCNNEFDNILCISNLTLYIDQTVIENTEQVVDAIC